MALLLMLSRKVHQSVLQVRSGRVNLAELTGFDLQGKTIGVIGAGHIGLHVIRIARGIWHARAGVRCAQRAFPGRSAGLHVRRP